MASLFIGLGSNLGDRPGFLRRALHDLQSVGWRLQRTSSFLRTAPVGGPVQPDFVNAVAQFEVRDSPLRCLETCLTIEHRWGRVRSIQFGPRTLDLDLIVADGWQLQTDQLQLPHPRLLEREFVLRPLAQLAPRMRVGERTVAEHLTALRP